MKNLKLNIKMKRKTKIKNNKIKTHIITVTIMMPKNRNLKRVSGSTKIKKMIKMKLSRNPNKKRVSELK